MTPPMVHSPAVVVTSEGLQELIEGYARAFGVDVWCWLHDNGAWKIVASTSPPLQSEPGSTARAIRAPYVAPITLEIGGGSEAQLEFLTDVATRELRHRAETRLFGREIADRYEEITLLYTISEILASVLSLEEATRTILAEIVDTLGVQRAALWLHDPESNSLKLAAAVGDEVQQQPIPVEEVASITATVFRERRPMTLEAGDEFPREVPLPGTADRSPFLSVPLSYTPPQGNSRTIGVINLIGRTVDERFSAGDRKLITAIASQVAAAVENRRLIAAAVQQERMEHEMELAHDLQLKLLPATDQFRGLAEVAARCAPAESVGGDFYHLFRLPARRFGVAIGDVSSHGFGAALIMALTMTALAIHASEGDTPAEVLRRVHEAVISELESTEMYLTLFYAVIDPEQGSICYANAGHPHAFRIDSRGHAHRLAATNPPFGMIDLADYRERSLPWSPGHDLLFLFTDGLADALGVAKGEQLLVDHVARQRATPFGQLMNSLFEIHTRRTQQPPPPPDDRSAVLLRV